MRQQATFTQVTLQQVAERAGVSITTVSRVINYPAKVASPTRQRVETVIKKLAYQPLSQRFSVSANARTLLAIIDHDDFYLQPELLSALDKAARQKGYSLLIVSQEKATKALLHHLPLCRQICAILMISRSPVLFNTLQQTALWRLPKVMINQYGGTLPGDIATVGLDYLSAAFNAVSYLCLSGHSRIACLSCPASHDLQQGYLQALQRYNIAPVAGYQLETPVSFSQGAIALKKLLTLPKPPTALFCNHDYLAIGVLWQAKQQGIAVHESLAIMGFGDSDIAAYCAPTLSSVSYSLAELAKRAIATVIQSPQGENRCPQHELISGKLVLRGSSAD